MPKAADLKRGSVVDIDGAPHEVEDLQIQTPSARGGSSLYKVRFRNLVSMHKLDRSFKGDDMLKDAPLERQEVQFSYQQADTFAFMNLSDYSEFTLTEQELGPTKDFLTEDLEGILALISNDRVLSIQLPAAVDLDIEECDPSIRGASATARTKPATLTTGLVVQVPEYLSQGERIRVDTRTGKYISRC